MGIGGHIETPVCPSKAVITWRSSFGCTPRIRDDVYARKRASAARLTPGEMDGLSRYYSAGFR